MVESALRGERGLSKWRCHSIKSPLGSLSPSEAPAVCQRSNDKDIYKGRVKEHGLSWPNPVWKVTVSQLISSSHTHTVHTLSPTPPRKRPYMGFSHTLVRVEPPCLRNIISLIFVILHTAFLEPDVVDEVWSLVKSNAFAILQRHVWLSGADLWLYGQSCNLKKMYVDDKFDCIEKYATQLNKRLHCINSILFCHIVFLPKLLYWLLAVPTSITLIIKYRL